MSKYRSWENSYDYLFILNEDNYIKDEDILHNVWLDRDGAIDLGYSDDCIFDNREVRIIRDIRDKICYALACHYNDDNVISVLYQIIPGLKDVRLPYARCTQSGKLNEWIETYGFDLKEFFLNNKYVVISDKEGGIEFENLADSGLINWNGFEHFDVKDYIDEKEIRKSLEK